MITTLRGPLISKQNLTSVTDFDSTAIGSIGLRMVILMLSLRRRGQPGSRRPRLTLQESKLRAKCSSEENLQPGASVQLYLEVDKWIDVALAELGSSKVTAAGQ
jgi:hypothetical protein